MTRKQTALIVQKRIENMVNSVEYGKVKHMAILNHNYYFLPYQYKRSNSLKYVVTIEWINGPTIDQVKDAVKCLLEPGIIDINLDRSERSNIYGMHRNEQHYESLGTPRKRRINGNQ